ncbi:MAG: SCO family protein [Pseudomonadota bacterium]
MNKGVTNTVIGCVAFIAVLLGLLVHKVLTPTMMNQEQMSEQGLFVYELPRRFTEFTLIDHNSQDFTKEQLKGHWTLMFFGYTTCPDVCPTTLASISQFHELLREADAEAGANLQVVLVSVDPMRDTPEKLDAYVHYFGEDYIGATGEYINIFNLAHQLNIAFGYLPGKTEGEYEVTHSGEIALINPEGDFHGFFKSPPNPQKMLATYQSMLMGWQH